MQPSLLDPAFLDMGGYAGFVWPAYGVTALVLLVLLVASLRSLRKRQAALDALEREAGGGAARRGGRP
jgi:heme exporter protein D